MKTVRENTLIVLDPEFTEFSEFFFYFRFPSKKEEWLIYAPLGTVGSVFLYFLFS
jgi:hypothetical protein